MHTEDFDDVVEDVPNVVGWDYRDGTLRVFVSEKLPESELSGDDLLANAVAASPYDVSVDVVPVGGEPRVELLAKRHDPEVSVESADRKDRHRPTPDGVSEINAKSTAATAGWYKATVTDPSAAKWADDVEAGDTVRLSNNHVYARSNDADLGEPIMQPSPVDGGRKTDRVGQLRGYVPIEDGVRVDIAARSVGEDTDDKHDLPDRFGTSVRRDNYGDLEGKTVRKTGRTTGVSTGEVLATSATVNVRFPDFEVKMRDTIVTTGMSRGGDSGSDVFVVETGEFAATLFAGSESSTILVKAGNIEADFGVRIEPNDDPDDDPPDDNDDPEVPGLIDRLRRIFFAFL